MARADTVDVIAVVGACGPERHRYARDLAAATARTFFPATGLELSPSPVDEAVAMIPWTDAPAGAVVEFPATVVATELVGNLTAEDTPAQLTSIVCVVDAPHLLNDLDRDDYAVQLSRHGRHHIARAMLTALQLEYASVIVFVNWEGVDTPRLARLMALASHVSPHARLRLHVDAGADTPSAERGAKTHGHPGWVSLLNDEFAPRMTDPGVSAFRYEQARPLHPARLQRLLDERIERGEFGAVIRSAGFCRLATRPCRTAQWDHVGRMISFSPVGGDEPEELLALGQDLAFIGLGLDHTGLTAALDDAALTDAELTAGPARWARFADPFPAWSDATRQTG
ncbi:MAG: GTP-binding protein [Microbacterium sp.]|uniref:GTP-binding protein n=1 Tax=Microbacterium sp. TaxID=51671 RepID=UPI0039E41423